MHAADAVLVAAAFAAVKAQQQYGQPLQMMYQQHPGLQQQQPQQQRQQQQQAQGLVASTSDNSGSGNFMLASYGAHAGAVGSATPGMPSPIAQHQQQAYILSPQAMQPMFIPQLPSPQGVGMGVQGGAGAAAGLQHPQQQQQQHMGRTTDEGSMEGPMVQLSLQVTGTQFGIISNQLYNISTMSRADLTSAPVAAGLFHINITGTQAQVTTARQLITSLLS
jgi:hypothetical protein